jgi:integrase
MPKRRLTVPAIERMSKPSQAQVDIFDQQLPSFGLRISKSGTKSFFVTTRVHGRLKRITLGRWPALSLADARARAGTILEQARSGFDPIEIEAKRKRADARQRGATFDRLVERFMTEHVEANLRPTTAREYRRYLQGNDTARWRDKPVSSITKDDVTTVILGIKDRGSPSAAGRGLAYLSKFFNWCAQHDIIETPPTLRLSAPVKSRSRDRVLTSRELAIIWQAFEVEGGLFGPLFKLLLLTGQRRQEVAGMRWDELRDLESAVAIWQLPRSRTKNKRPHIVPLSPPALTIINRMSITSDFVFSATGTTPVSGFGKAKARVDRWTEENYGPIEHWTLHDLRRTMVTVMNEDLRIAPHVAEAVVNHVSGAAKAGVAGVYNRALYLDERRRACVAWGNYVVELVRRETQ